MAGQFLIRVTHLLYPATYRETKRNETVLYISPSLSLTLLPFHEFTGNLIQRFDVLFGGIPLQQDMLHFLTKLCPLLTMTVWG